MESQNRVIDLSTAQLGALIKNVIQDSLPKLLSEMNTDRVDELLTREETAVKIRRSLPKLDEISKEGRIKRIKQGKNYFYFASEIERYLKSCEEQNQ